MVAATRKDPVYVWAMQSSQPRGGDYIVYETRLNEDGNLSCNCPGWINCRGSVKVCKHTRKVGGEAEVLFRRWSRGEELPRAAPTEEQLQRFTQSRIGRKAAETGTTTNYGRFIDLD